MDEQEALMAEMWKTYQPYYRGNDDRLRCYIADCHERSVLEVEDSCVTICQACDGSLYLMS
jgi:hypothetical protein